LGFANKFSILIVYCQGKLFNSVWAGAKFDSCQLHRNFMEKKIMLTLDRITSNPVIMNGKPCIRGKRITVWIVLNLLANGMSKAEILDDYPYLEQEDIEQCLQYAASSKKLSDKFAGKLPPKAARKLQDHIRQSREEWDR